MYKFFKVLFIILLSLIIPITGFYFWASSPNINKNDYTSLITNNFKEKFNNDSVFSIITYNIGYLSGMTNNLAVEKPQSLFDNNLNQVLTRLKNIDPDIIAFQEIDYASKRSYYVNQQNEIAKLGYNFVAKAVNWDKKYLPFPYFPIALQFGKVLSGQSILSKYRIIDQERIELARNKSNPFYYDAFYLDRLAQVIKINIQGKTLVLINVHLEAYHQETRMEQTEQVIKLFNQFSKTNPTILLGDFNSDLLYNNASIKLLIDLPDTGNTAFDKNNMQNTFDSKNPSERLDFIFYNTNFISYLGGSVLTEFEQASDHLPLLMNFKFK